MLRFIKKWIGSKQQRDLRALSPLVSKINALESEYVQLKGAEDFQEKTKQLKARYEQGESLDSLLCQAYALAREASRRTLLERSYDTQLMGAIVLHQGKIMELKTGEGKTLSSVAASYLNSLTGKGVHVVTVNDYLAQRDAQWMKPVFEYLGVSVDYVISSLDYEQRKKAYQADITYVTNNELGFDYLRDNMCQDLSQKVQRGHHYCIIDEIDSILIDEARTPLIISGAADDDTDKILKANQIAKFLKECAKDPKTKDYPDNPVGDYKKDEKNKSVYLTNAGMTQIEKLLLDNGWIEQSLYKEENFQYTHYVSQALKAHTLFEKDVDYILKDDQVQIVDEFTGRVLEGRRYSDGLHQAIEAKENIAIAKRNKTMASITFQNFFRMYDKISGMTGTADTEAKEFVKIYQLDVVVIPTNRPVNRIDDQDMIYYNQEIKFEAIADNIKQIHEKGQPILVGTVSVESSEHLSHLLKKKGIPHEVLNAKNHTREAFIIAQAGSKGAVTIATNMAGRGTDIKLGGNLDYQVQQALPKEYTPEEHQKIYEKEYAKWVKSYQQVCQLGGLYIIGTERHESRRIDNQLRGRSGRQGDPGHSQFFVSLEDHLMRIFAQDRLRRWMGGMMKDAPIQHRFISHSLEVAQKRVEDRNFEIRKHLLEYDDVVSKQREFIYGQRDSILESTDLTERIRQLAQAKLDEFLNIQDKDPLGEMTQEVLDICQKYFQFVLQQEVQEYKDMPKAQFYALIQAHIQDSIDAKVEQIGSENVTFILKMEYIRSIDNQWQNHLEQLESLIEAVNLRSFAQKNPLVEYKQESARFFSEMIENIRNTVIQAFFHVNIVIENPSTIPQKAVFQNLQLGRGTLPGQEKPSEMLPIAPIRRQEPKVGRNDPCPCGSGKKYKNCHGLSQ